MNDQVQSAANTANAVMGIYGISGSGKSSLADTGAEEAYETFSAITLCYAADLGGFGNKRLTLIRHGIMRVWDPRNHVNPFETMELMSLGAFPERLIDPERGFADPNVKLIRPRRSVWDLYCPQGHLAHRFDDQRVLITTQVKCPTCAMLTTVATASKVDALSVKHPMFERVGLRIYDSFTALNEWGMADLQEQSARGMLPAGSGGGSALGSADALRSGQFAFGTSSMAQYGFLQNRTYGWLANIKTIPDQVMPAIATFLVEQSKGDDNNAGEMLYGPKISGTARTAALGAWLGHLLHQTKEPYTQDLNSPLVYRLWLTNHIDPRDQRRIPYIAKHRGTPLGMPDYLEDKPGAEAWSGCSLRVFYRLQREQLAKLEAEAQAKYPNAPGMWRGDDNGQQGGDVQHAVNTAGDGGGGVALTAVPFTVPPIAAAGTRRRRAVGAAVGAQPTMITTAPEKPLAAQGTQVPTPVPDSPAGESAGTPAPLSAGAQPSRTGDVQALAAGKPIIVQQLEASLAERAVATQPEAPSPSVSAPPIPSSSPSSAPRVRRVARPPV